MIRPRFLAALEARLSTPAAQRMIRDAIAEELRTLCSGADEKRARLLARIDANRKRAGRLVAAIAEGGSAPSAIVAAISDHEAQIRADERALSELADPGALEAPSVEAIAEAVTSCSAHSRPTFPGGGKRSGAGSKTARSERNPAETATSCRRACCRRC